MSSSGNGTQSNLLPTATGEWGQTAIIALWVPVVAFAHAFALFWLAKTWMLNSPALQRKARMQTRQMTKLAKQASLKIQTAIKGATPPPGPKVPNRHSVDDAEAAAGDQTVTVSQARGINGCGGWVMVDASATPVGEHGLQRGGDVGSE